MDTGKILMGTAMLLLMIGLVVHPASAGKTGIQFTVRQDAVTSGSGQAPAGSSISCSTGSGSSGTAMHPYERPTIAPASLPASSVVYP